MIPQEIQNNCALDKHCDCADGKTRHKFPGSKPWLCPNWGRSSLSSPAIVQSKQDRLRMTRGAWDKKRDKMMRDGERRLGKFKPQSETEEKLREARRDPIKHLERTGRRPSRRQRVADQQ